MEQIQAKREVFYTQAHEYAEYFNEARLEYEKETVRQVYTLISQIVARIIDYKSEIGKVNVNNGRSAWLIACKKAHSTDYALALFENGCIGLVRRICFINGEICNLAFIKEVDLAELKTIECSDPIICELVTLSDFFKGLIELALKSGIRSHDIEVWKKEFSGLQQKIDEFVSGF